MDISYLMLEDGKQEDLIAARSFAGFFRDYQSMKLVVLNARPGCSRIDTPPCGNRAAAGCARHSSLVAMQYPFADTAAGPFAREFYRKLCTGSNRGRVDAAVSHADRNRLQMDFVDTLAFATPVLYMRSPTGVIFDLATSDRGQGQLLACGDDIDRLKAVRTAHQSNIALLVATESGDEAKTEAIRKEGAHIAAIDGALRNTGRRGCRTGRGELALVLFASWIGLFNVVKMDDWLERRFVGL